jgi:hypothetical protein
MKKQKTSMDIEDEDFNLENKDYLKKKLLENHNSRRAEKFIDCTNITGRLNLINNS